MERYQAIDIICEGKCSDMDYVTCDQQRGKAGELRTVKNPIAHITSHDAKAHRTITVKEGKRSITIHTGLIMKVNGEFVQ